MLHSNLSAGLSAGHDTHPIEIKRAPKKNSGTNLRQRNLQLEAKAHIVAQGWIDGGDLNGWATSQTPKRG